MKRLYPLQTGASLVEVLISFVIFAIGMLGLAQLHAGLIKGLTLAAQRVDAVNLAESKLAELRNFQTLTATSGMFSYADINSGSDTPATANHANATYNRIWNVVTHTNPDYKAVVVTVSWTTTNNTSEQVLLQTIIAAIDPLAEGKAIG